MLISVRGMLRKYSMHVTTLLSAGSVHEYSSMTDRSVTTRTMDNTPYTKDEGDCI